MADKAFFNIAIFAKCQPLHSALPAQAWGRKVFDMLHAFLVLKLSMKVEDAAKMDSSIAGNGSGSASRKFATKFAFEFFLEIPFVKF